MKTVPITMKTPATTINNIAVTIDAHRPDKAILERAASILKEGGLVVVPTETRYGLLARADDDMTLDKMFAVKKRPLQMPTAIFCQSVDHCWELGRQNEAASALAKKFLPGPLTLILKATKDWNRFVTPDRRIGIRYSSSPVVSGLLQNVSFPVTATSANRSGAGESDSIEQIHALFGSEIDLYLDAGILDGDVSTVVDCTSSPIQILRQGSIPEQEILSILKVNSDG